MFRIAPQTTDSAPFLRATDMTTDAVRFQCAGGLAKDIRAFHECLLSFHRSERGMAGKREGESTPCDGKNYEFVNYDGDERETRAREEMHALLLMRAK